MSAKKMQKDPTFFVALGGLIVFLLIGGYIYGPRIMEYRLSSYLDQNGAKALAKVISITDTGSRVNHNPQVILKLEVQPEKAAAFSAEIKTVLSTVDVANFKAGSMVQVKYDPKDTSKILLGN